MNNIEIWIPIKGFEGRYDVSSFGNVRRGNKKMKSHADNNGYLRVHLSLKNKSKFYSVHRLVVEHFIGEFIGDKMYTNHKDGIKSNNTVQNLEIVTSSYNKLHSYRVLNEIPRRGSLNGKNKLNKQDVDLIKRLRLENKSFAQIGYIVGISATHAHRIINNKAGLYL